VALNIRFAAKRIAIALAAIVFACVAAECAARLVDGYSLRSLRLVRASGDTPPSDQGKRINPGEAAAYLTRVPLAPGVDAGWFAIDPDAPPPTAVDPELDRRYWAARGHELPSVYEWNLAFVRAVLCGGDRSAHPYLAEQFQALDDVYVFEPPSGAPFPTYRFLRSAHYPYFGGLVSILVPGVTAHVVGRDYQLRDPDGNLVLRAAGAIAEEVHDPARNVPRAIMGTMVTIGAITVTGNHRWIDVAGSCVELAIAFCLALLLERVLAWRRARRASRGALVAAA